MLVRTKIIENTWITSEILCIFVCVRAYVYDDCVIYMYEAVYL